MRCYNISAPYYLIYQGDKYLINKCLFIFFMCFAKEKAQRENSRVFLTIWHLGVKLDIFITNYCLLA